jgi:NADPH:quinone reductase-like Zn-dependent oxidoreductase
MKAVIHERYGSPDDLRVEETDLPAVGDDEVLVRVRAASVATSGLIAHRRGGRLQTRVVLALNRAQRFVRIDANATR